MPRGLLLYRRFDLESVPASRRSQVLGLKLQAWRPTADAAYFVGWQGSTAQVWAWSRRAVATQSSSTGLVPETVIQRPPTIDGFRLVEGMDGFEGQFWSGGILRAGRWWKKRPSIPEWQRFQRSAGAVPAEPPVPIAPAWMQRPWARPSGASEAWFERNERSLALAATAVFCLALGWQLAGLWKVERAITVGEQQLAAWRENSAAELQARDLALEDSSALEALLDLEPSVNALALLTTVSSVLPLGAELREWRQDENMLNAQIESPRADSAALVRAFESVDELSEVMVERERTADLLVVTARVRPVQGRL